MLTKDQAFRDFFNDQKNLWFQNIGIGNDESQEFDELCQQVGKKLLDFHLKAGKHGKSLHHKTFEMLQLQTFLA